jgi:DNA-binding transcriptional LysR family regulator
MRLRDMEYFIAIGEHRHVRRAAESLGLTQPALSKGLRRLERALGAKLVERTARGIAFTSIGAVLLARMRQVRLSVDDVTREAAELVQGLAGHVRMGVSPITAAYLPLVYSALRRETPKLTLEIVDSDNDVMVPALRRGELDLIFNFLNASPAEGTAHEHVLDEVWGVFASAKHRLAKAKRVTMGDVAREHWALSSVNIMPGNVLPRAFFDRGLSKLHVAVEARSIDIRLRMVACSDLLTFTSRRIVQQAATDVRLKELPVKELTMRRRVGAIYRESAYLPPSARRVIELLKSTAGRLAAEHGSRGRGTEHR